MKDQIATLQSLPQLMGLLEDEIKEHGSVVVSSQGANIGKWGMAKLWRIWMASTAKWMADNGATMPLVIKNGKPWGEREFKSDDAHDLFTMQWLGVDTDGNRLSWSKTGRDGMRAATKGERFTAMLRHEQWMVEKAIAAYQPRDSEFMELKESTGE